MHAITVLPGVVNSARLDDIPPPPSSDCAIPARTLVLTRRVPVARWHETLENRADDIKVIVDFGA